MDGHDASRSAGDKGVGSLLLGANGSLERGWKSSEMKVCVLCLEMNHVEEAAKDGGGEGIDREKSIQEHLVTALKDWPD